MIKRIIKRLIACIPVLPITTRARLLKTDFFPLEVFAALVIDIVKMCKPMITVELGTGEANCTVVLGLAIKACGLGRLFSFDSFGKRIAELEEKKGTGNNLKMHIARIHRVVKLIQADVFDFEWREQNIDLLVVDIDNNYERLMIVYEKWISKVKDDGMMLFEGGYSKYRETPRGILYFCEYLRQMGYQVFTFQRYPGLTIAQRRPEGDY